MGKLRCPDDWWAWQAAAFIIICALVAVWIGVETVVNASSLHEAAFAVVPFIAAGGMGIFAIGFLCIAYNR